MLLRTPDRVFLEAMSSLFPSIGSFNDGARLLLTTSLEEDKVCDVWFTDLHLVTTAPPEHWRKRQVPHIFHVPRPSTVKVPPGWVFKSHSWRHCDLGGATIGEYQLGLLLPSFVFDPKRNPAPLPQLPWAPLSAVINDVEYATRLTRDTIDRYADAPSLAQGGEPPVRRFGTLLDSRGLGLSTRSMSKVPVVVGCVFNPSKLGSRFLTGMELGALHGVPILFLDHLKRLEGAQRAFIISRLLLAAPGKVLFLGSDYLLTRYVRGGGSMLSRYRSRDLNGKLSSHPVLVNVYAARQVALTECSASPQDPFILAEIDKMHQEKMVYEKDDDSPIHFHIWDEMFLVSRAHVLGEGESLASRWKDPISVVATPPCQDPRDCRLSDTQTLSGYRLPRWRWALTKLRAALLRYWRRKMTQKCVSHLRKGVTAKRWIAGHPSTWVVFQGVRHTGKRKREKEEAAKVEYRYEWRKGQRQGRGRPGTGGGRLLYKLDWTSRRQNGRSVSVDVGRDCISRTANSLFWGWSEGSGLLFWTWPRSHLEWAREGQPHFLLGELPRFRRPQQAARTPEMMERMKKKVNKVRRRRYIEEGEVTSLTHMFAVAKGSNDIRMVYNGTSSGLNDVLFAPHFGLPTLSNTSRALLGGYHQTDLDVAEMFLCFWLHPDLRPYAGVDVSLIRTPPGSREEEDWEQGRNRIWERWHRNFMGMRDSPYRCMQMMLKAKYCAYGDRKKASNPFKWDRVVLNLPGAENYDPSLPWVMKIRDDGHLACDIFIYVDDGRVTGWSKVECWRAVQHFSSVLTSRGIQDAYRKRTLPLPVPGPWAGGISMTRWREGKDGEDLVYGLAFSVTQAKWDKMKSCVGELETMLDTDPSRMDRGRLEEIRGFLIYTARTFDWLNPYLKGLHLTIDGWRPDRDAEGYRIRPKASSLTTREKEEEDDDPPLRFNEAAIREAEKDMERGNSVDWKVFKAAGSSSDVPPATVKAVPRLAGDVATLAEFVAGEAPDIQRKRVSNVAVALYLMGDASGAGFGSALWNGEGVSYEAGNWKEHWKTESSNYREASNLTARIEKLGEEGKLDDTELFVFTDNSSYEGAFYKGHSKTSPKLTELVRRLRMVERKYGCILHVIHIAGTRMKMSGVDGLSRGDLVEGIMAGMHPWDTIPLNEGADERTKGRVEKWVRAWWNDKQGTPWTQVDDQRRYESSKLVKLEPEDWFSLKDIVGHRLWMPPPAAMETIVELFNEDRMVNPHLTHVFVIPRLMTHLWRKQLFKDADVNFYVKAGAPFWPSDMHEPLTVVIVLPLAYVPKYRGPWIAKHTSKARDTCERLGAEFGDPEENGRKKFTDMGEPMPSLWDNDHRWTRDILFQFLQAQSSFPPVQSGLVRGLLPSLRGGPLSGPKNNGRRRRRKRIRNGGNA